MENLLKSLFNIIYPPFCFHCNKFGSLFCLSCLEKIDYVEACKCIVCGRDSIRGLTHLSCQSFYTPEFLITPFCYMGIVKTCILDSKFKSKAFCVFEDFTEICLDFLNNNSFNFNNSLLVPVPMSLDSLHIRGFNQSEVISEYLAKRLKVKSVNALEKSSSMVQHFLSREERFDTSKNLYKCVKDIKGKDIVLVDDICTTGATFLACAHVLKEAGARYICCFALASTANII